MRELKCFVARTVTAQYEYIENRNNEIEISYLFT